jgi:hypothetical protein
VKEEMITKNKKMVIVLVAGLLLVSALVVPLAFASTEVQVDGSNSDKIRILMAKGVAKDRSLEDAEFVPAGFTLDLMATEVKPRVINFAVISGTVKIDEAEYTILEGEGAVIRYRRGFLLKAQGVDADGEEVTLKLVGRYFWMGGRVYVARLAGLLETQETTYLLFLRSAIRV